MCWSQCWYTLYESESVCVCTCACMRTCVRTRKRALITDSLLLRTSALAWLMPSTALTEVPQLLSTHMNNTSYNHTLAFCDIATSSRKMSINQVANRTPTLSTMQPTPRSRGEPRRYGAASSKAGERAAKSQSPGNLHRKEWIFEAKVPTKMMQLL